MLSSESGDSAGLARRDQVSVRALGAAATAQLAWVPPWVCASLRAVPVTGSEKAAAHRLGLSHSTVKHHLANARSKVGAETTAQLVWILAPRLPEPEDTAPTDT